MNDAFLMKLGWGLMTDPVSLWGSVLRSKYLKYSEPIHEMKAPRDSSALDIFTYICKDGKNLSNPLLRKGALGLSEREGFDKEKKGN